MEKFEEIFRQLHTVYIPELTLIVKDNIVLMCMAAFVIIMMYVGRQRGFMDRVLSLGSVMVTLAAEFMLFPHIMRAIEENEAIGEFFLNTARSFMHIDPEHTSSPLYDLLGLDVIAENAADLMETLAVKIICFAIVFVLLRLLVRILSVCADGLKRIHLINSVDRLLGMITGFAEAMVFIWIFMLIVSGLPTFKFCSFVLDQIVHNDILLAVYDQNLLLMFAANLLG